MKNGFFKQSQSVFENVLTYLYTILPKKLPDSGFLGGEVPGEDDFHLGAWLTRIALTCGAQSADDGLEKIAASFGKPLSPKVEAYWKAWSARSSWKEVYGGGSTDQVLRHVFVRS